MRWPDATGARERHLRAGTPCLLVVGATERAAVAVVGAGGLGARDGTPRRVRHPCGDGGAAGRPAPASPARPHPRGAFPPAHASWSPRPRRELVALLVERFGETVSDEEIRALSDVGGVSTHSEAVKTALRRMKDTLAPLGLHLARVRAAGYLLDRSD